MFGLPPHLPLHLILVDVILAILPKRAKGLSEDWSSNLRFQNSSHTCQYACTVLHQTGRPALWILLVSCPIQISTEHDRHLTVSRQILWEHFQVRPTPFRQIPSFWTQWLQIWMTHLQMCLSWAPDWTSRYNLGWAGFFFRSRRFSAKKKFPAL